MSAAASWTCSSCDRRVPPRVDVCRCGARRAEPVAASPVSPPATDAVHSATTSPVLLALPLALLVAVGAWWWTRPAPTAVAARVEAPAPSAESPSTAAPLEPPPAAATAPPAAEIAPAPASAPIASATALPIPAPAVALPARGSLEDVVSRAIGGVVMVEAAGSRGTGFFVAPDLIVTNEHVVGRDSTVTVRLHDGATRMARVERTMADLDLALLRTAAAPSTPVLALGRADLARVGQEVIAIGSALGLQSTVTRGILSAKRQSGAVLLLQTDAAINPGNSGGPLLDRDGAVLGVTTLKVGGPAEGLGFAVAADHVRAFIDGRALSPTPASRALDASGAGTVPPVGSGLDASADGQRAAGTAALDRDLQQLAQHAAQIDAQWSRFDTTCQAEAVRDGDRPWFALATRPARFGGRDRNCPYWLTDLEAASRTFADAMRASGEQARRAGVYPGDQRTLRRQYRLDWSGFDR